MVVRDLLLEFREQVLAVGQKRRLGVDHDADLVPVHRGGLGEAREEVLRVPVRIGQGGVLDVGIQGLEPSRLPVVEVVLPRHDHVAVHLAAGVELDRPLVPVLVLRKRLDDHLDAGQLFKIDDPRFDVGREGVLVHQKTDLGSLELLPVDGRKGGRRRHPYAQQDCQCDEYHSSFHTMPPPEMLGEPVFVLCLSPRRKSGVQNILK